MPDQSGHAARQIAVNAMVRRSSGQIDHTIAHQHSDTEFLPVRPKAYQLHGASVCLGWNVTEGNN
jgi:hypothetical protein